MSRQRERGDTTAAGTTDVKRSLTTLKPRMKTRGKLELLKPERSTAKLCPALIENLC